MVAQTQAQVAFTGSGNLDKLVDKLNDSVKNFGISTGKAAKGLTNFNKEAKATDGIFKTLSKNVKGTAEGFLGLGRNTKDTLSFFTKAGKNTLDFSDAVEEANKGVSGLGLKFLGLKKQTNLLNQVLEGPAAHLADIADASSNTERAFIVLSKIAKPLRAALVFLSEQADKLSQFFLQLETTVVKLIKGGISIAIKAIEFFSKTFSNLSQTVSKFGIIGKTVSNQFSRVGKALSDTGAKAEQFNQGLDPENLERVNQAGEKASTVFGKLSKGLQTAAAGVILADTLGKVVRSFIGVRETAEDAATTIVDSFTTSNEIFQKTGASTKLFNNRLATASATANTLGGIFNNNLLKGLGAAAAQANNFIAKFQTIKIITQGVADAALQMSGLNDAFAQAQALGIDTTAAEIAFQFGLVGEKLLFSAEAAKEFGKSSITAFAQTEDAAAFVTTLSSGARLQFEGLEEGLQSVTAFSTELANSLDNTVTSGEAANALYNTLSAGIGIAADNTQDLGAQQNFLEASLKLSSGTGADAAQTLDLLAKTTKVYGLSANDASQTAAKLNQVVEQGQITFPQLTNQLGRTLATAEATNVTLDETLASVSALTKVQGEDALVGFSSLLSSIAGQGAQAQKEIQELGIQFDLQTIKSKGLNESLRDLVVATGGNAEVLKRIIPDTLAFQTALTLVNSVAGDVDQTLDSMGSVGEESLEAVFAAGQQSTIKQFTNIMNGFNEVLVDFGQRVQPALQPGLEALRNLLGIFQTLPEPIKNVIGVVVIAQTALSNMGGGLLGLGITLGKLILSIVAFRLVNKALTGQLKSELDVIKQLVNVEGDYAGALTRLVGLNENFSSATIQTTKAINNTKKALKGLEAQGFEIKDDSVMSFQKALEEVKARIREVQSSPLRFTDPEGTQIQVKTLKELQKQINETIQTTNVARTLTLKETRKNIDDTLKEVNVTVAQRISRFEELLLGLVNPNLVGGRSGQFQVQIKELFEDTLRDASLSAEEKVGRISDVFRQLRTDSPESVRGFLREVEAELLSGFGRIEGQADKLRMTLKSVSEGLFVNSAPAIKQAFDQAVMELEGGFTDMQSTLQERKKPLSEVFKRTIEALPEELDQLKPKLVAETNKLLDASRGSIESRITEFNKTFAKLASGLPNELKQQAGEVKVATQQLARAIEAPLAGRDNFGVQFAKAAVSIRNGVETIEKTAPKVKKAVRDINKEVSDLGGPQVRQEINQNLDRIKDDVGDFARETRQKVDSVSKSGGKGVNALSDSLDGLGGVISGVSPQLSGLLGMASSFLSSSQELTDGLGQLSTIGKGYGKTLTDVAASSGNTAKAQGVLAATNRLLGRNMFGASTSANAFAKAATAASSSTGLISGASAIATAGLAGLSTAFTFVTTAAASMMATIAPLLAPIAALAGGLFLVFKILQKVFPAFGRLTDANMKLAAQIEETNEVVGESLDLFKKYKESSGSFGRDAEGNAKSLAAMKEEITKVNEELEDDRPSKVFVQGFRGAIINVLEILAMLPQQIVGTIVSLPLKIGKAVGEGTERIAEGVASFIPLLKPVLGAVKTITNSMDRFEKFVSSRFKKTNDSVRNFFNQVRADNQAFIAEEALAATKESSALTDALLVETDKVRTAQASGEVAAERSKSIIAAAEQANRALSANELNNVIQEENQLARLSIELINEQIKAREEELEKAKDPQVKENLQFQLENLRKQSTELEKRNKLQEEFLRNQQAIGQNIQANQAAQSQAAVNTQLQQTIKELGDVKNGGEEAQKIFKNILGVVEDVNQATGETQFIRPDTVNQASQAGRRAELAVQSTVAKVSSQIANLNNIESNLSQDDIAQGIFQVFDAVDKAVAEDPKFAQQGSNIINSILTQGAEASGAEGTIANIFSPTQISELLERQTGIIETEFQQRTKAQQKSLQRIAVLQESGAVTAVEAARATAEAQTKIDTERVNSIQQRIKAVRDLGLAGSQQEKDLISELEQFQMQSDLNRLKERRNILEQELNLLRAQKDNEIQLLKNQNQERLNSIQLTQKASQQEQSALEARRGLVQAVGQFEETLLQNRLKLTGDIEEKADIQIELAKQRIEINEQSNEFERQNIKLQQELNKLSLEREQIQLRIQAAEAQAELAANSARLAKAEELNLTKEEQEALQLQNEALNIQTDLLSDSSAQLEEFAMKQEETNQQQLEALDLRQKAQREAANVDLELAQRNRIIASFDKQIKQTQLQARLVDVTNKERIQGLQSATALLDGQTRLLEEQKSILESTAGLVQSNFQIAISAERNEFRKRRLQEEAAKARLKALETQQKIELAIFKINEQQKDLALEVRQIELSAAQEKAKAELAVAEAEAAKIAADPTSTKEAREAARLNILAAQTQIKSTEAQQKLVSSQRAANAQGAGLRELQFSQQQSQQQRDAEFALAQTTRRRSDDRQIGRAALSDARIQQQQFEQLSQNFLRGLSPSIGELAAPNINVPQPQALGVAPMMPNQNITSDLNVNVNISGSSEGLDKNAITQEIKKGVVMSWNEFVEEIRRRNQT